MTSLNPAAVELLETFLQRRTFFTCLLEADGSTHKQTLIDHTGFSQPTVDKVLDELSDWDLVESSTDGVAPTVLATLVQDVHQTLDRDLTTITGSDDEPLWPTAEGRRELLQLVANRLDVLESVGETPQEKRDLVAALDASRSTVNRAVRKLETAGIVGRTANGYAVTPAGRRVVHRYHTAVSTIGDVFDARSVLVALPRDSPVRPALLAGASSEGTADAPPYHLPTGVRERITSAERVRIYLPVLAAPRLLDCGLQRVVRHDATLELLTTPATFETLTADFPGPLATMVAAGGTFSTAVVDTDAVNAPSFGLVLAETGATTTVSVLVHGDRGTILGTIHNESDAAVEWGDDCYASVSEGADELTDDLRELTPAAEASQRVGSGTVYDAERVAREAEGFVRLTPEYFARRAPSPPTVAWRTGFGLADVHAGYALDREATRDGNRFDFADDLVSRLRDGTDHALLGAPGSGKSTVCKSVACRWYEQGIGPVFYRTSDSGATFDSTARVREHLRTAEGDGHVLVVVEDAVRADANAIFRVMQSFSGSENVTFLLDARASEWNDHDTLATDVPREAYHRETIETVTVPSLDAPERERVVRQFERATGHEFGSAVRDELRDEASVASDAERATATDDASELLPLVHRLVMHADPLTVYDVETPTTLVEDVRRTCQDLYEDDELVFDVCLLATLLDVAGIGVRPALLSALADEGTADEIDAVRVALSELDGRVVFETETNAITETAPYRTVHERWSALFLDQYLELTSESAARRRAGRCLTALLALADDETKRNRIAAAFADAPSVERIETAPEKWAEATVERLFDVGLRRSGLAPLFGRTDDSHLELPEACSLSTAADCTLWRAKMARQRGVLNEADEEYEALSGVVGDADAEDSWAKRLRGQQLHGRGTVAWRRSEFDAAESYYRRAIDYYRETDDGRRRARVRMDLGLVSMTNGDYETAETAFDRSRTLYHEFGDVRGEALALANLAGIVSRTETLETAIEQYQRALDCSDALDDYRIEVNCLQGIGRAVAFRGDLDRATSYCTRALERCRERGIRDFEAYSLAQLGLIRRIRGDFERAEEYHRRCLDIRQEIGDRRGEAWSLATLGTFARERGAFDAAVEYCTKSREICLEIDDRVTEADGLTELGAIAHAQGNLDTAEERASSGLDRYEEAGNRFGAATSHRLLGRVACDRDRFETAEDHLRQSLDAFEDMGYRYEVARTLAVLGDLDHERGNSEAARERLNEAVERFREIGAVRDAVRTCDRLAAVCESMDELDAALERCESGSTLAEDVEFFESPSSLEERRIRIATRLDDDDGNRLAEKR